MATNVLVYDGPGVSMSALQHTLRTLRRVLPAYDVQTVTARSLALEPWPASTALLVLPGGRDLPYVAELSRPHAHPVLAHLGQRTAADQVARYVHAGGAFLGICAGAYYSSARCVFEQGTDMEVIGERPAFRFFPGECVGTVYPGFVYESDAGARLIDLELSTQGSLSIGTEAMTSFKCQYNGGGAFVQADSFASQGVTVLARYSHSDPDLTNDTSQPAPNKPNFAGQAAAVLCQVNAGKALLYGSHPEFPLSTVSSHLETQTSASSTADLQSALERAEALRLSVFSQHLALLGLKVEQALIASQASPVANGQAQVSSGSNSTPSITDPPRLTPLVLATHSLDSFLSRISRAATASGSNESNKHLATINDLLANGKVPQPALTIADGNDTFHIFSHQDLRRSDNEAAQAMWRATQEASYEAYTPQATTSAEDGAPTIEADPDLHTVPKYILALDSSELGGVDQEQWRGLTPHFDMARYMASLRRGRERIATVLSRGRDGDGDGGSLLAGIQVGPVRWGSGDVRLSEDVMYGQVVTSTQTMLDKNFKLLRTLPTGFTSIATHQVSGRGRGKNAWISPLGCFQFSLVLRLPASAAARIVFVQYLAGLAVALALRDGIGLPSSGDAGLDERVRRAFGRRVGEKVRIKWPNDLYAEVGEDSPEGSGAAATGTELGERKGTFVQGGKRYAKLGGILVNSQFADNEFLLVVGCGVNVLNRRPTTSISDLILTANASAKRGSPHPDADPEAEVELPILSQEDFGAGVLATLEKLWTLFEQAGSFAPFIDAYKHVWLHSDQLATLADADPPPPIRIVGISSDYGYLRAVHASSALTSTSRGAWGGGSGGGGGVGGAGGDWIDLQPDGNSFDMLHNLIRRKE